jgi:nucleoside-diphosphate-sugar epimerase
MAPYLVAQGYDVVGLDTGYFSECTLVPDPLDIPEISKDLRDVVPDDLKSFYAVIHLAALSNDPIGNLDEGWTEDINFQASMRLAELARDAGARRFLFSSSCIMYGMSAAELVNEASPLDPQTEYARSKVKAEDAIRGLACDGFSPVYLRNGTVYGVSPRMRFDTVLNNLVGAAVTSGKITVFSDGKPWRPVVHVEDVARSFQAVLEAPAHVIHNEAFNNGANHLNHQVFELAEIAAAAVPGCKVEVLGEPGADQRTYKADFAKFAGTFPDFEFKWNAVNGARELAGMFERVGLSVEQYEGNKFIRLRWLNHLLETGELDSALRWSR